MAAEWFYRNGSEEIGPISPNDLRALAKSGKVVPQTPIRKSTDDKWVRAARVKGLFGDAGQATQQTPPPLAEDHQKESADLASKASESIGNAASAVLGGVSEWIDLRKAKKAELIPASDAKVIKNSASDLLTGDNQSPEVVAEVTENVKGILIAGEEIVYVAVQQKPIVNIKPDCIAITNKRFIFFRPKLLGRVDFEDYIWRELHDAKLSENVIGSTFSIKTAQGQTLKMDYLPKSQARAVYRLAQEKEEQSLEERRQRSLEEKRATSGGTVVQTNIQSPVTPPESQPTAIENNNPMEKLKQLKEMADAGLISDDEYTAKKAEILSKM